MSFSTSTLFNFFFLFFVRQFISFVFYSFFSQLARRSTFFFFFIRQLRHSCLIVFRSFFFIASLSTSTFFSLLRQFISFVCLSHFFVAYSSHLCICFYPVLFVLPRSHAYRRPTRISGRRRAAVFKRARSRDQILRGELETDLPSSESLSKSIHSSDHRSKYMCIFWFRVSIPLD